MGYHDKTCSPFLSPDSMHELPTSLKAIGLCMSSRLIVAQETPWVYLNSRINGKSLQLQYSLYKPSEFAVCTINRRRRVC